MKQTKTSKKVLSMLMVLTMLIGMMTAVTVNAEVVDYEVVKTINFDDYEVGKESSPDAGSYKDIYTSCTATIVANADDSNDLEVLVSGASSVPQHRINIQGLPFEQGETYKITFDAKAYIPADVTLNMSTLSAATYIGDKALSNDWKSFELEYTHTGDTTNNGVIVLMTNVLTSPEVNKTWIDDIVVSKKVVKPEVTVKIKNTAGGAVNYNGAAVSYGEKITVAKGGNVTLTVTPVNGYHATATVDGVATEIVNNQITLEAVSADSEVSVIFTEDGWENVYYLDFKDSAVDATSFAGIAYGTTLTCVEDNGSKVLQISDLNTSGQLRFNTTDITFEKGASYRFTARLKGSKAGMKHSLLLPGSVYPKQYSSNVGTSHTLETTDWFVAQKMAPDYADTYTGAIAFMVTGAASGDNVLVDYFIVEKQIVKNDVTVNIEGEGGAVSNGETAVANGDKISVVEGEDLTLTITPNEGYSAKVMQGDQELLITNNAVTLENVTAETTVTVTFTKNPDEQAAIAAGVTYEQFTTTDLGPTIFVYSKLNNFTPEGNENLNYGIKLWNTNYPEDGLKLNAYDPDNEQPAIAEANAPFAIRAYGKAITADQEYAIQPFVGETEGETLPVKFGE